MVGYGKPAFWSSADVYKSYFFNFEVTNFGFVLGHFVSTMYSNFFDNILNARNLLFLWSVEKKPGWSLVA